MQTQEQEIVARKKALITKRLDRKIEEAVQIESEKGTEAGMKVLEEAIALETKYRHVV